MMDELLEATWRVYPATMLIMAGLGIFLWSLREGREAKRSTQDPDRAWHVARGFRTAIFGLCAVGIGVGWIWQASWVVFIALIILAEEMWETSVMVETLQKGRAERDARALGFQSLA